MHCLNLLFLAGALGCAVAPVSGSAPTLASDDLLPPATKPITVDGGSLGLTLAEVVSAFADSTGQLLVMDEATRSFLASTEADLSASVVVPPAEVYSFVEGLLIHNGLLLARLKGGEHPMLGLYQLSQGSRRLPVGGWLHVDEADLPKYVHHPALLVKTVAHFPGLDVRQVTTSLRGLITDTSHQTMLAVGPNSMILRGTGKVVAETVALLKRVEEAALEEAARQAQEPPQEEQAEETE